MRADHDLTPETGVLIRPARPDEYQAVAELTVQVYVGDGYVPADDDYAAELADVAHRAAAAEVLVAVHDGRIAGSLTVAKPGTTYAEIARPGELEFRMLAVAKQARGHGVGTALVRAVIQEATAGGYEAVALTTMATMVDAHSIYERLGFVAVPERNWLTHDGLRLFVMRLALN
ncbi:GNAT family N-acetyltransferase [Nocardia mangyaensis]|uniref:GNAT family N-acetyltransferase n=1 Tax=Nocardia mangyaensis TaxID=2213200 RepID=A0A1J0W2T8_9NOCA|nr:GNAT family N-acetyltransferase [Nocardia mangyaensis]APE38628.1 GNAT family N-acetyltransferase [Nocardia mangyaensis]MDO3645896.1 GNAT family N-acetyltransferase [Nocardia mangyaensis]